MLAQRGQLEAENQGSLFRERSKEKGTPFGTLRPRQCQTDSPIIGPRTTSCLHPEERDIAVHLFLQIRRWSRVGVVVVHLQTKVTQDVISRVTR